MCDSVLNMPRALTKKLLKKFNEVLENINKQAHQWKMSFNLDLSKMAKEDLFSRKKIERFHHNLTFIGKSVHSSPFQKHLGLVLDSKLNFVKHLKEKISIVNNALLRRLRNFHSIRYFWDVIQIIVMPFMTKCAARSSNTTQNRLNIMLLQQYLVHLKKNCTMNSTQNISEIGDGYGDFVSSIKFST